MSLIQATIFIVSPIVWVASGQPGLEAQFKDPPSGAGPWVFWYWMDGAVSPEGIRADLEAMKAAGLEGAYLFFVKDVANPPIFEPPARQLSDRWWQMLAYTFRQAHRLGLALGLHTCDGFSLAAGPWITPELAMQRVVWSFTHLRGPDHVDMVLPMPPTREDYYRDIAILAFPSLPGTGVSTRTVTPTITTSIPDLDPNFLITEHSNQTFRSDRPCWIQYQFSRPFTCRSIRIVPGGTSFQALRLRIEAGDDPNQLRFIEQLRPPRHGWQDRDPLGCPEYTFSIRPKTAKIFRFVYDPRGSEPGAEDLDTAKWRPSLRIRLLELSSEPRIDQFEGKSGLVWRVSPRTTQVQIPQHYCLRPEEIVDLTTMADPNGRLRWSVPDGNWTILRIGHTCTGQRNTTAGGAMGLECDKLNPDAVRLQFEQWFGRIRQEIGPDLLTKVLKVIHADSWEAASQNWTRRFPDEFRKRRGYDLRTYLPVMAGIPVSSADVSERVLYDIRQTIAELLVEAFYSTIHDLAHSYGCLFSAECTAPTMAGDGMLHFKAVDIPMGEFWLNSPTHDKPTDILEAISAAHIYGKNIIQAEAFTELRQAWDEDLASIKALGDLHLALGINRLVVHLFVHNPWLDRKPGMTMGPVGLFFQRDQTWWPHARAWTAYISRCQMLLQLGRPVVDLAVFTGQQIPTRAILPERLIQTLPGLIGKERIGKELKRLANDRLPLRERPFGVVASANIRDWHDWLDPLSGYAYDCINHDALIRLAKVVHMPDARLELPGGTTYRVLVIPAPHPLAPDYGLFSPELAAKLLEFANAGLPIILCQDPVRSPGLANQPIADRIVAQVAKQLKQCPSVVAGPLKDESLRRFGIESDLLINEQGSWASGIAWNHRSCPDMEVYFISNQKPISRILELSMRVKGVLPELWDPLTGQTCQATRWICANGRTSVPVRLEPNGSLFIVLRRPTEISGSDGKDNWPDLRQVMVIEGPWSVRFDPRIGGPNEPVTFERLQDWTTRPEPSIRYYSGTAEYTSQFDCPFSGSGRVWLDLGAVHNIADVKLHGLDCGIVWTWPYRVEITRALRTKDNRLQIFITNTWANRLMGEKTLPAEQRLTWTSALDQTVHGQLRPSGLIGPVKVISTLD